MGESRDGSSGQNCTKSDTIYVTVRKHIKVDKILK